MIVVKDFYADWCQPCKMIAPHMEKLEKEFPDITIEKINVDENSDLAAIYQVRNIPLVIIEKDEEIVEKIVGAKSYEFYSELIKQYNE
jgi:thioredoxin 1